VANTSNNNSVSFKKQALELVSKRDIQFTEK